MDYEKHVVFERLLNNFETTHMELYCKEMIQTIPDYLFEIPSSTSLKYHNATQCKPHGQIYHILMFGEIMNYILGLEYVINKTTPEQRDCFRCTPIFHDALKCGTEGSKYTVHEHPILAGKWIRETIVEHDISQELKDYIARLCESHSGQWTSSKKSETILPSLENDEQFLVHLCDYLSSRNNLDMIYDNSIKNLFQEEKSNIQLPKIEDYKIDFGRYEGYTLLELKELDFGYFQWMAKTIKDDTRTVSRLLDELVVGR